MRFVETAEHSPLFPQEFQSFLAEIKWAFGVEEIRNYARRIERTKRLRVPQRAGIRAISYISEAVRHLAAGGLIAL